MPVVNTTPPAVVPGTLLKPSPLEVLVSVKPATLVDRPVAVGVPVRLERRLKRSTATGWYPHVFPENRT